jgi:phosphinothricin acetyltransferase
MPSLVAIYRHAVETSFATLESKAPGEAEMKVRWRCAVAFHQPFIVAEDNRKILAFAYVSHHRDATFYQDTVENFVCVRNGWQGRGIGTRLLSRLVAEAAGLDYRQMVAVIGDGHKAAIRIHEKLGFEHVGTMQAVAMKEGRFVDTVLMQRALGTGATTPS